MSLWRSKKKESGSPAPAPTPASQSQNVKVHSGHGEDISASTRSPSVGKSEPKGGGTVSCPVFRAICSADSAACYSNQHVCARCARPVKQEICRWNPAARVSSQGVVFLARFGNRPEVETCRTQFYFEALESFMQHQVA